MRVVVALAVELACLYSKTQSPLTTPELIAVHACFTGAGGIKGLKSRMQGPLAEVQRLEGLVIVEFESKAREVRESQAVAAA